MTVQSTDTRVTYTGDGVTLDFPFNMKTYDIDWINVYENGVLSTAVITVTLNADQKNNPGGSVNINPSPVLGVAIIIERYVSLDQLIDYTSYNGFPADDTENGLDKLTFITQQLLFDHARAIRQSGYEDLRNMLLPSITDRALRVLAFDQDGNVDVSDTLAVPIQVFDCTVSINAEPYNADPTGLTNSTAGILAALASGATRIVGCPGQYWVDYTVFESNCVIDLPGVEFFNPAPSEGNGISFGNNANITTENCHVTIDKLTGYDYVQANNYKNCSLKRSIIDTSSNGLIIGAWSATGLAENFVAEDVLIQNCILSSIAPSLGVNNKAHINFRNVSIQGAAGSTYAVQMDNLRGSWIGGNIKDNQIAGSVMYLTNVRGFKLSGVEFDHNGNVGKAGRELHLAGNALGLDISGNTFENNGATLGTNAKIYGQGATIRGCNIAGNHIAMSANDNAACVGIDLSAGALNNFVAGNVVDITGIQTQYNVDVLTNYLIVDGVKQ